jgi:signal peptidase I
MARESEVRALPDGGSIRPEPRAVIGVVLIGALLGPAVLMLWLGKWRLALLYLLATIAFIATFLAGINYGYIPPLPPILLHGVRSTFDVVVYPVVLIGMAHGLALRKSALDRPWYARWYVALPVLPVATALFALGVRAYLLRPFNTPAGSGVPNLIVGDYFFVSKRAYGAGRPPQRGDIAVFKLPRDGETDYVKRVVGLPGERIQMIGGILHIDGVPVKLEPVELPVAFHEGEYEGLSYYRETLPNGRSYVIANDQDNGDADNTEEFVVPAGHYFMMVDNRDNSLDSRFPREFGVGLVPVESFVGRFAFRFWNNRGFPLANRPLETAATD